MRLLISAIYDESSPFDFIVDRRINTDKLEDIALEEGIDKALIIWGGEDIATGLYGQKPALRYTDAGEDMSIRDRIEVSLANEAIKIGMPIIGICRGAQLMCAVSGGSLIQHVDHHAGYNHIVQTSRGERLMVNSVHHQMMNPFKVDHKLLAWTPERLSKVYIGNNGEHNKEADSPEFKETEMVWFPKTKALCIQGHPEYRSAGLAFIRECLRLAETYIFRPRVAEDCLK